MHTATKILPGGLSLTISQAGENCAHYSLSSPLDGVPGLTRYDFLFDAPEGECDIRESGGALTLKTPNYTLCASEADARLRFLSADGRALIESAGAPVKAGEGYSFKLRVAEGARVYGLGDVKRERVERTGLEIENWVRNISCYVPIPFMMSPDGWGLFINTTWRHDIDVCAIENGVIQITQAKGALDIYLFAADGMRALLKAYTRLTGRPAMLPRWAYGLTYVCDQHVNSNEMMGECLNFRREGIPCDVCGLEPGWMSKYYDASVNKQWHPERFFIPYWLGKGPATFFGALDRLGFKLSLWLCCDYDLSYEEERRAAGIRGVSPVYDARPRAHDEYTVIEEAWFKHLEKFVDQGARCFKLDGWHQIDDHPDRLCGNMMTDEEMHNLYPLIYNRQMAEGFSAHTSLRPMVYSSGGYAGIQKFSATWAGDTGGGAEPLASMLNHGLSGHSNVSCDMDVFQEGGIHFGFFQAWSQLCNWAYFRQPWYLTPERKEIFKKYARLRYRLLPYIYTAARLAHDTGLPIMRAMPLMYPNMPGAEALTRQYMFGDALLAAAFTRDVRLPDGQWYDAWTGETLAGGRDIRAEWGERADGALYVRAGAILPCADFGDYIGDKQPETIELNIYPSSAPSEYELYEDQGDDFAYASGEYARTLIRARDDGGRVRVEIEPRKGGYAGMPAKRNYIINIMTLPNARAAKLNGADTPFEILTEGWCERVPRGFISVRARETGAPVILEVIYS